MSELIASVLPAGTLSWPPQYTIRKSAKARRIFLQIHKASGLEIVIPKRQKNFDTILEQLLIEKRTWIEKNLKNLTLNKLAPFNQNESEKVLPEKIEFKAIEENWQIFYHAKSNAKTLTLKIYDDHKMVWIIGDNSLPNFKEQVFKVLRKWCVQLARKHLIPWLHRLSMDSELIFNQVRIRGQSTLWGSCNSKKNISLNYKLLFLPKFLTHHVLLHELCHVKYLNHSKRFWRLLNQFDVNAFQNKKILKSADDFLPSWVT